MTPCISFYALEALSWQPLSQRCACGCHQAFNQLSGLQNMRFQPAGVTLRSLSAYVTDIAILVHFEDGVEDYDLLSLSSLLRPCLFS